MDIFNPAFWTFVAVIAGIYTIIALGLYVQFSLAGLPNFGHVAFMAVAAYTMAILVVRFECAAAARGARRDCSPPSLFALISAFRRLRLRADYLAIATVAGGEIVRYLAHEHAGAHRRPDRLDRHARAEPRSRSTTAAGKRLLRPPSSQRRRADSRLAPPPAATW